MTMGRDHGTEKTGRRGKVLLVALLVALLSWTLAPRPTLGEATDALPLSPGWNFVSFPKVPPQPDVATVLGNTVNTVRVVWTWDSGATAWKRFTPAGGTSNSLSTVEGGKGYWIYADAPGSIDMTSWSLPSSTRLHLSDGWNLVGHQGIDGADAADELTSIEQKWDVLWNWSGGAWTFRQPGQETGTGMQSLSALNTGRAYWLKIRQGQETDWPAWPDLPEWLNNHPGVASAIKWQFQPANTANVYAIPDDGDKLAWASWSASQKYDLNLAYLRACAWLAKGAPTIEMPYNGLTDQPENLNPNVGNDSVTVLQDVSPAYMWRQYVANVAFSLALELTGRLPWSIVDYDDESLRYLFDSTVMGWHLKPAGQVERYAMGTYFVPAKRADNRPRTAFAPPAWVYRWLKDQSIVGTTRLETIGGVLEWMRQNLVHFAANASGVGGSFIFGDFYAVWQYRGYPPVSKIVNGTVDANNPAMGVRHWTAGCHGSVAFLHEVLRAVNIPVQPVFVCGHELPYFVSEKRYMDHGDDPYNRNVQASTLPMTSVLIDEPTYQSWFTTDLTVNITDTGSPACQNVGRRARELAP